MASSSKYKLSKARQLDVATPNYAGADHQYARRTGGGFDYAASYTDPAEVRPEMNTADQVPTDLTAGGSIEGVWAYDSWEPNIEDILGSLVGDLTTISGDDFTATAIGNLLEATLTDLTGILPGEIIRIFSALSTQFDPAVEVLVDANNAGILSLNPTWITLADEGAAAMSVTIDHGKFVREGVEQFYSTFEEEFDADDFQAWISAVCTAMNYNRTNGSITNVSFDYQIPVGAHEDTGEPGVVTKIVGGPPADPATTRSMSHKHVNLIHIGVDGGTAVTICTTGHNFSLARAKGPETCHNVLGAVDFVNGTLTCTGQIDFLNDAAVHPFIELLRSDTEVEVHFREVDVHGNVVWVSFPGTLFTAATRNPGGRDAPVILNLPFATKEGTTAGFQVQFQFLPAPVAP